MILDPLLNRLSQAKRCASLRLVTRGFLTDILSYQIELDIDADDKVRAASDCIYDLRQPGSTMQQIRRIKEKVEEQAGVPPPQQRLIHQGKQMCAELSFHVLSQSDPMIYVYRQDDKTARELNITAGAVLHLVLALRGGQ